VRGSKDTSSHQTVCERAQKVATSQEEQLKGKQEMYGMAEENE
jgi:hypothetical protein